jgi:Type II secretion system protein C
VRRLLLAVDVVLVVTALYLAVQLADTWRTPRAPVPTEASKVAVTEPPPTPPPVAARSSSAATGVIAERNLFSPGRREVAPEPPRTAMVPAAPPAPKPRLYGVVIRPDGRSRAFLEDAQRNRVFAYAVGDAVAGGRLERIEPDRVVLSRGGETLEVLLRDPTKPKPPAPPAGPGTGVPPSPAFPRGGPPAGIVPPAATPSPRPGEPASVPTAPPGRRPPVRAGRPPTPIVTPQQPAVPSAAAPVVPGAPPQPEAAPEAEESENP